EDRFIPRGHGADSISGFGERGGGPLSSAGVVEIDSIKVDVWASILDEQPASEEGRVTHGGGGHEAARGRQLRDLDAAVVGVVDLRTPRGEGPRKRVNKSRKDHLVPDHDRVAGGTGAGNGCGCVEEWDDIGAAVARCTVVPCAGWGGDRTAGRRVPSGRATQW